MAIADFKDPGMIFDARDKEILPVRAFPVGRRAEDWPDGVGRGFLKNLVDACGLLVATGVGNLAKVSHMRRIQHVEPSLFPAADQLVVRDQQRTSRTQIEISRRETALVERREVIKEPQILIEFQKAIPRIGSAAIKVESSVAADRVDVAFLIRRERTATAPDAAFAPSGRVVVCCQAVKSPPII